MPPTDSSHPSQYSCVICLGDSITEGRDTSPNWVNALQQEWPHLEFHNEGVDSDYAWHAVQRFKNVSDILEAQRSGQNYVIIMIGTNDVMGSLNHKWEKALF